MSREIKFRLWNGTTYRTGGDYLIDLDGDFYNIHGEELSDTWVDEYVLEQYTGLKDKNGKEIYEGDIVKGDMGVFEVKWYDLVAQFMFRPNMSMKYHPPFTSTQLEVMEVIGNIHEPPKDFRPEHLKSMGVSISKGGGE